MSRIIQLDEETFFDREEGRFVRLPEIIQFEADKTIITDAIPAIVRWEIDKATTVTLNNESVPAKGERAFHTTSSVRVELAAINEAGIPIRRSVTISAERRLPVIHFFRSDRDFIIKQMPVILSWNVTGAARISIDNGVGNVSSSGSTTVLPSVNGGYNLVAENFFGDRSTMSLGIAIFPIPLIQNIFLPKPNFTIRAINSTPAFNISTVLMNETVLHTTLHELRLPPIQTTNVEFVSPNVLIETRMADYGSDQPVKLTGNIVKQLQVVQEEIINLFRSIWKKITRKSGTEGLQQS